MPNIPYGFSFGRNDGGFIIRHKDTTGLVTAIPMTKEDIIGFKHALDFKVSEMAAVLPGRSGSVQPIIVHPVENVSADSDIHQESVLLTMETPSLGQRMTFSISPDVAEKLATELPLLLAQMRATKPTRQ